MKIYEKLAPSLFCLKFARGVTKKRVDQAARALEEEFLNKKLVVVGIKAFRINVHKKGIIVVQERRVILFDKLYRI